MTNEAERLEDTLDRLAEEIREWERLIARMDEAAAAEKAGKTG